MSSLPFKGLSHINFLGLSQSWDNRRGITRSRLEHFGNLIRLVASNVSEHEKFLSVVRYKFEEHFTSITTDLIGRYIELDIDRVLITWE